MVIEKGIALIVFTLFFYVLAFGFFKKGNWRVALLFVVLGGLVLRIYVSLDPELHKWDERYHALVAKNFLLHPFIPTLYETPVLDYNYKDWTWTHVWLHKQPLPLWMMAVSINLFGNNEFAVRLPSIILSSLAILLIYFICNYFFDRRTAFLSAILFSFNGMVIELTGGRVATDHIDIAFMFFVLLSVFAIIKWKDLYSIKLTFITGLIIGLSMLCKWLPGLFVVPIWMIMRFDFEKIRSGWKQYLKETIWLLIGISIIFLPWQIYTYLKFPHEMKWETIYNFIHISEGVEGHSGSVFYFFDKIRINYGELIYLPLFWFIYQLWKKFDKIKFALLVWFLLPFLFFSMAETKMQGYILFASPPLFMLTSAFFFQLKDNEIKKFKWLRILICFLLIALPIRYCFERVKPFDKQESTWSEAIKKINLENGLLFNYDKHIEAMFYTNVIAAYPFIPSNEVLDSLHNSGYKIFINVQNQTDLTPTQSYINILHLPN